ncbi:MAG: hypothetical protein H7843_02960 [Nitrospirota bacterium]
MYTQHEISDVGDALILFADVIDSSKYSATLGYIEYAKQLHKIQSLFKSLGKTYFPPLTTVDERVFRYSNVDARGDEGTIFCHNPDEPPGELVFKAIQFSYELKGRLHMIYSDFHEGSPKPMKLGIGIHFDKVALITEHEIDENGDTRLIISNLEGYSINYAKRIESCSRLGKYSQIFLSKRAAHLLEGEPVVLSKQLSDLKGIQNNEEVFEVQSAFISKMPFNNEFPGSEQFFEKYGKSDDAQDFINEPWQKSFVLSVISTLYDEARIDKLKTLYFEKISQLVWVRPTEDDPIVLFTRAKMCGEEGKHTQKLGYLKNLVKLYPNFIHARIKLAEACWEVAKGAQEKAEIVFARNIADEFLCRFVDYLSDKEKEVYEDILSNHEPE